MHKTRITNYQDILKYISSKDFSGRRIFMADESVRNVLIYNLGAEDNEHWRIESFEMLSLSSTEYRFISQELHAEIYVADGPSPSFDNLSVEYIHNL